MRELKFSLNVAESALFCPNPTEWYLKSYVQADLVGNFRMIPGVKTNTKIASNVFNNLMKPAGCAFEATDTLLKAEDVSVCHVEFAIQICQTTLEESFVSQRMAQGDANWQEVEFLNHFWSELQESIIEETQLVRWNGDSSITGTTNVLRNCDGYLVNLEAATGATENTAFTAATFTSANIIDVLIGTIDSLPEAVKGRRKDVRIYMSESNAFKYSVATLGLNTDFSYTGELDMAFAGYKISVQPGMSDDYIVAGNFNSFGYAFDGSGDSKSLKIVNMMDTTVEPVLRARVAMKIGFPILNDGKEVAYTKVGA